MHRLLRLLLKMLLLFCWLLQWQAGYNLLLPKCRQQNLSVLPWVQFFGDFEAGGKKFGSVFLSQERKACEVRFTVTVVAVEIGLLTPPFGLSAFVIKSTLADSRISLGEIFRGAAPFAIIMGVLLGGQLVGPNISSWLLSVDIPLVDTGVDTAAEAAIAVECVRRLHQA